jgi:hypothetical protein
MVFSQPITQIIPRRFSCRQYLETPIAAETKRRLGDFAASCTAGPLGTPMRFILLAASDENRNALRGLGTYGFIRSPTGFLVGAVSPGNRNLEQWAYQAELIVLLATDLGLGTVWVGGLFTRSSFARAIGLRRTEELPAVIATGVMANPEGGPDPMRRMARGHTRSSWDKLFFDQRLGAPLSREAAGAYAEPLEMLRLGPSASNKQPWRVVRQGEVWHFYLHRTPNYPPGIGKQVVGISDIQRLDMGIAMCHFELTALEAGLTGRWQVSDPGLEMPSAQFEYTISWVG